MRIRRFNEDIDEKRFPTKVNQQEFFAKRKAYCMGNFSTAERTFIREILNKKGLHSTDIRFNPEYLELSLGWSEVEIVKFHD